MESFRVPPAFLFGTGVISVMLFSFFVLPGVLGPGPAEDPVHAAFLPPGTRVLEIICRDEQISTPVWEEDGGFIKVGEGDAQQLIPIDHILSRKMRVFVLGSDRFGRDLLRMMLSGGRISLGIALAGSLFALLLGLGGGLLASSGTRLCDGVLMRLTDVLLAFPPLLLLILAAALFEPGPLTLVILLASTSWMGLARLVRGQVLSLRNREYVLAARLAGTPWYRVWLWHYLPFLRGPVFQDTALRIGDLILAEATLSYLGLGLPATIPTWGRLVNEGYPVLKQAWWISVIPGCAISLLVIAFAVLGDALREMDPAG